MATNPTAGLSDPAILRKTEAQLAQAAVIANGKPAVSGSELILPSTTVRTTSNTVITTTSANNDPGDTVTVYTAPQGGVYVSSIDQTVRQTVVNNPIAGVSSIIAGNNVSISSTGTGGTGAVTINASLSSVGNIAVLNLDGNASNVLHGDGTWSADQTTYSNSNVVSLLSSFGSNTITTTGNVSVGNIIGNGQALTGLTGANVTGAVAYATTANSVAGANVSGEVAFAATANSIAGANISGEVAYAATANSVSIANVSGAGNIALINLDGNASNVLHGDGTWSADITNYNNSNVVSLLASFGSNTISTTGLITGDGGGLSNVPYANVTGTPSLGNVSALSLDGNVSNVLRGDGTWAADTTGTYGDSNVTSLLGAFGSNTITTTGIITADGYGLSNVLYANITGTPSLGNVSVLNLDGNASNLLTGAGTYVAIPVVPTLGNIATINIDGSSSNILYGNGVFAAVPASTYGDSNVVTLLSSFGSNTITTTGNVAAGAVTASGKIGYSAGANVTQTTSRSTSVTINGLSGEITLFATSMSAGAVDFFTVTNNQLEVGDMIICTTYAGSAGTYLPMAFVSSATQAVFTVRNLDAFVTASESPVIKFIVIKAPNS